MTSIRSYKNILKQEKKALTRLSGKTCLEQLDKAISVGWKVKVMKPDTAKDCQTYICTDSPRIAPVKDDVRCQTEESRNNVWKGEDPMDPDIGPDIVSDDISKHADKYKAERLDVAIRVLTDQFRFYLAEIQIEEAGFYRLSGRNSMYISCHNKFFIRSTY